MSMRPKPKARETRTFTVELERRADDADKPLRIVGHPVVYNRWSEDLGGFKERVLPGAFTKTLAESDIRALFNHDANLVLGRNVAETLILTDSPGKLRMEVFPPETDTIRDLVVAPMERGDVDQMSFGFRTVNDEWREPTKPGALWERDLIEARLFDVSIVTFPAYTQTDASVRSVLEGVGINFPALTSVLTRAERGLGLTDSDHDLITASIEVLRSYLTEPASDDDHSADPEAGRPTRAHLLRQLLARDLEARQATA